MGRGRSGQYRQKVTVNNLCINEKFYLIIWKGPIKLIIQQYSILIREI